MRKDLSVVYNGKLLSVKDALKKLKELNFDVHKIEKAIAEIESDVESKIEENYHNFDKADSKIFLHDAVTMAYTQAISKLERIDDVIKDEYNTYYVINAKYIALSKMIEEINKHDIDNIIQKGMELLDLIKQSSTIDYNMEKSLVENIYKLIYKILKLELIYGQENFFLNKVAVDETDSSYLVGLVKENIEKLPKKERKDIDNNIAELAINGLDDSNYLNRNLLAAIIVAEDNSLAKKINNKFTKNLADYKKKAAEYSLVVSQNDEFTVTNKNLKKEVKKTRFGKLRKVSFMYLNTILITAGILSSGYILKDATRTKAYLTTTKTYDSSMEEETSTETYESKRDDALTLVEYSPWDDPGYFRDQYTRNVYTYDLKALEDSFTNLEGYLNSEIKDDITFEKKEETSEEKPNDFDYQGNKYVITKVKQNPDKFKLVHSNLYWGIATAIAALGITVADYLLFSKVISPKKYKEYKEEHKIAKEMLKENKENLIETKNTMNELEKELLALSVKTLSAYEALPQPIKNSPKMREKVLELRDKKYLL